MTKSNVKCKMQNVKSNEKKWLFVFFSGKVLPGYTTGNMSSLPQLNRIATR